jgi:phospholipid/cholesterol/gamma-HCH transport system substrate-binding protein
LDAPGGSLETNQRQSIKVGIFVIGLTTLLLATVFVLGGSTEMLEDRYTLQAKYADVAGLKEGAVVRLAGWDVGKVKAINFSKSLNDQELTVEMSIMGRYKDRIRTDSEARIDTVGVLGDKYVSISMGSPGQDRLNHLDEIRTRAPLDFLGYTKKFEDILQNTASISRKFDLMLGDEDEVAAARLGKSFEHMEDLLGEAREGDGLLHALVYDEQLALSVNNILQNLERASANLADTTTEIRAGDGLANELIYGHDGATLAKELGDLAGALSGLTADLKNEDSVLHAMLYEPNNAKMVDDLAATASSLRRTSAAIESGDGTLGLLAHDPSLYQDLRALMGGAQRNKLLRSYIRRTIREGEKVNAGAWEPQE